MSMEPFQKLDSSFDVSTVSAMSVAYDKAVAVLHDRGQPVPIREIIAKQIIVLASEGVRDVEKLWRGALIRCGIPLRD